jgi:hypothetical protein
MKKPTKRKVTKRKYAKAPKLNMSFDEAMRRIIRVSKDELDELAAKEKRKSGKSKKPRK